MSSDVAEAVGQWAEGVENRSLLHEKFALPKVWNAPQGVKIDDAGRWNILRIVENGKKLLEQDAGDLKWEAEKAAKHGDTDKEKKKSALADVVSGMARSGRITNSFADQAKAKSEALKKELEATFGELVATFPATLASRMMVNMAGGVIENAGISLDRLLGLPFIPGSAVKGISRQQALWDIHNAEDNQKEELLKIALVAFGFGSHDIDGDFAWAAGGETAKRISDQICAEEFKGCIAFLPGYPVQNCRVVVDMVNPHYPRYYSGHAKAAEDTENPIPNYFPAVESGAVFQFSVAAIRESTLVESKTLLAQVQRWTESAVSQKGVGAKTAAGYGWFRIGQSGAPSMSPSSPATVAPLTSPEEKIIATWYGKLNTAGNFPVALPVIAGLADDAVLKKVFEAVIPEPERRKLVSNPKWKNQPYWQSFLNGKHTESAKKILTRLGYLK
jgi:CRISPR type III-B/RAMP module RAMP protein Cmr6